MKSKLHSVSAFRLCSPQLRLTQVEMADATDDFNELVHERHWLLHPSEKRISLQGNLFAIEDLATGSGHILVRQAPLPASRPVPVSCDLLVTPAPEGGFDFVLPEGPGADPSDWTALDYQGRRLGRTRALHRWQASLRPATRAHSIPSFMTNTWGDRSCDSRISEDFIRGEIQAARKIGADVVQIDDGWQKGVTGNSPRARELGGVLEGFWNKDPGFWEPDPEKLPRGLEPLVAEARKAGVSLGMWFAPDSWDEFANWRRDADLLLGIFSTHGIAHFKVDAIKITSARGLARLHQFFRRVEEGSRGEVVFDLDITADVRPGYFGAIPVGPLFVENRYTDWRNYWPHHSLRNLWRLSAWVDPRRLRIEFLNHARNTAAYGGDPLAPERYSPDALFATAMFANPLGWFEASHLPQQFIEDVAGIAGIWREHRADLFAGTILQIGQEPDGFSPTGFVSIGDDGGPDYALLFRELHSASRFTLPVPELGSSSRPWQILAGAGRLEAVSGGLEAEIPSTLGYIFARR